MIILRNFLHTFKTNRLPEVLNILGLALSLAAAFIIFLQINYRLTFKDYDKIYRIATRQSDMMEDWGTNFFRHLIERYSLIQLTVSRLNRKQTITILKYNKRIKHLPL